MIPKQLPIPICPAVVQVPWHLSIGMFIAILGFLGVVVPLIRDKMGKLEKAIWVALFAALLYFELRSINLDQVQSRREQEFAQCENQRRFEESAGKSQQQFESTMQEVIKVFDKTEKAAEAATEAVNVITGGDSYCYLVNFHPESDMQFLPNHSAFGMLIKKGKSPLYGVNAALVTYAPVVYGTAGSGTEERLNIPDFSTGDQGTGSSVYWVWLKQPVIYKGSDTIDIAINYKGRNSEWRQVIHGKLVTLANGPEWTEETIVTRDNGKEVLFRYTDPHFANDGYKWNAK